MKKESLLSLFEAQKEFFKEGHTKNLSYRLESLSKLGQVIENRKEDILEALYEDLKKPKTETLIGEVEFVLKEIDFAKKHLKSWLKPRKIKTPFFLWPAQSYVIHQPLGVILIISPWNYPFRLTLSPLVGAIAAGNCVFLKSSEHSSKTSKVMGEMIDETFSKSYIHLNSGGVEEAGKLLEFSFDHIFFTGSSSVGRIVAQAASRHLTPVTLELGGCNPALVHKDAHLKTAVRRLAWAKFINNGQTCLAPNFVWIHKSISEEFLLQFKKVLREWFGERAEESLSLGRIINTSRWDKLHIHLEGQNIFYGGRSSRKDLFIEPTLILNPSWDSPLVKEELFGPLLPILEYEDFSEVLHRLKERAKPLSAYLFSQSKDIQKHFIKEFPCGNCLINDALLQATSYHLPFGGLKESGWGRYYGKSTFETLSHPKSVMKKSVYFDISLRYPPYSAKKMKLLKWFYRKSG